MQKGTVYKTTGSWYILKDEHGNFHQARLRGKYRIDEKINSTNPIAVGDYVEFVKDDNEDYIIKTILPRENYIVRSSPHNKRQKHIIASNLSKALLVATIAEPRTSQGFIDRFLLTCEMYHVEPLILFNKMDCLNASQLEKCNYFINIYAEINYKTFYTSLIQEGIPDGLLHELKDSVTLVSGHSGVGKSTLLNLLIPEAQAKTAGVSEWTGKGMHTTTFAIMYDTINGSVIDTPGIKEFGLYDIDKYELAKYFPEFRSRLPHCKFSNCLHLEEPGCAVKADLDKLEICPDRYFSYRSMIDSLSQEHY